MGDLEAEIKTRVSMETKRMLASIAAAQSLKNGSPVTISDLVRIAIKEHLDRRADQAKKIMGASLRVAEDPPAA